MFSWISVVSFFYHVFYLPGYLLYSGDLEDGNPADSVGKPFMQAKEFFASSDNRSHKDQEKIQKLQEDMMNIQVIIIIIAI